MRESWPTFRKRALSLGWCVEPEYQELPFTEYEGNPLIAALPPLLPDEEIVKRMAYTPQYRESDRLLPAVYRHEHLDLALSKFFEPMQRHADLYTRLARMIRLGYVSRNPVVPTHYADIRDTLDNWAAGVTHWDGMAQAASGLALLGEAGVGKTWGVKRALSRFPSVIVHRRYRKKRFPKRQIVHLRLDCPKDGSIRGLCLQFFHKIDRMFGTEHAKTYSNKNVSAENMLDPMANLGLLYSLGMLVVDEVQNINAAKSGGHKQMLQFFVELVNIIGMPVVLVGSVEVMMTLSTAFRQARRYNAQGDMVWRRMREKASPAEPDGEWEFFVEALWEYQYTQERVALDDRLRHVLYDECQGVIDIAVKIFRLSQHFAIVKGLERLDEDVIRATAAMDLNMTYRDLAGLRRAEYTGSVEGLIGCYDLIPFNADRPDGANEGEKSKGEETAPALAADGEEKPGGTTTCPPSVAATGEEAVAPPASSPKAESTAAGDKQRPGCLRGRKPARKPGSDMAKDALPRIAADGAARGVDASTALVQAGHLRPVGEFEDGDGDA